MVFPSCRAAGSKARRTSIDLPRSLPATIAQPRCCTSATTTRAARTCSWRSLRTWKRSHAILGARRPLHAFAVTPEQIDRLRLPTAPPKATDNRAFSGETCQAEALPPDVLANILRTAIEERVDQRVLDRVLRQERRIRRELTKGFEEEEPQ